MTCMSLFVFYSYMCTYIYITQETINSGYIWGGRLMSMGCNEDFFAYIFNVTIFIIYFIFIKHNILKWEAS